MRSRTPPWPGMSAELSLTPARRLRNDSNRSPTRPTATANVSNTAAGANQTMATTRTTRTAPLRTRVMTRSSPGPPKHPREGGSLVARRWNESLQADSNRRGLDASVTALALLVREDRFEQVVAAEVGPERLGHPDFRVRDLPEQEVADAHFAARPDQQIGIRLACRVEIIAELALVEFLGADAVRDRAARRIDDLGAPAVVQRDVEQHPCVLFGLLDADAEFVLSIGREFIRAAAHLEPHVVREERAELEADVPLEQQHQRVHFGARAFPVFDRKRIEREHVDAETRGTLNDVAHRIDAGAMPFDARQMPLRGPAPVAVHDDGDVRRQLVEIHLARELHVRRARWNPREELLERHSG